MPAQIHVPGIHALQTRVARIPVRDTTRARPIRVVPTPALRLTRVPQGIHAVPVAHVRRQTHVLRPTPVGQGIIHVRRPLVALHHAVPIILVVRRTRVRPSIRVPLHLAQLLHVGRHRVRQHQAIHAQQQIHVPPITPVAQVTPVRLTERQKSVEKHLIINRPSAHFRWACLRKTRGCNKYGV